MSYKVIGGGQPKEAGMKKGRTSKKKKAKSRFVEGGGSIELREMLNKNYGINGDTRSVTLGQ